MPDFLGATQAPELDSLDYLGTKVPTSFKAQPALPTGRPASASATAPSTIGGGGVAGGKKVFTRPESNDVMDMLRGVFDSGGGPGVDSGSPAAGTTPSPEGSVVGWDPQSFQAMLNFASPFAPGPVGKAFSLGGLAAETFGGKPSLGVVNAEGKVDAAFPEGRVTTGSRALDSILGFLGVPIGAVKSVLSAPGLTQEMVDAINALPPDEFPPELAAALRSFNNETSFALGAPGAGIATGVGPGQPGAPGMGSTPFSWGPAQTPPGFGKPTNPTEDQGTGLNAPPGGTPGTPGAPGPTGGFGDPGPSATGPGDPDG